MKRTIPPTINVSINLDRLTGPVLADTTQIHQVIINLCTNAYQSMQDHGGDLAVQLEKTHVSEKTAANSPNLKKGEYALLTVGDNGPGMTPETISKIFDPFFTTKEHGKGTGMGLAVVHGIVKNHGGAIVVESQPGSGTLFMVFLPIYTGRMKRVTLKHTALKRGSENILLIDDEPSLIDLGKRGLESLGYTVTSTTSPIEALEKFRADPEKFDIIITDQAMPLLTGDVLAFQAMKIRPDIPVIICTGHSDTFNEENVHLMGIRALLIKPVGIDKLTETIRKILDK